jgi:pantetheine-phosphate adenylyltransferase
VSIAVCPGSFDPFTFGHLDVVRRARAMFDGVVVGVAQNPGKSSLLDATARLELVRAALRADPSTADVRAELVPGLVVDFCRSVGATVLVKGLRGSGDLDAEMAMALMNRHLAGVETVFIPAGPDYAHIASSLVKDIARYGGDIGDLVPADGAAAVRAALSLTTRRNHG